MLSLLLLLALILPLLVVGLLVNVSHGTIVVLLIILAVIWIITRSYGDWKRKQEEQREKARASCSWFSLF
jgi:hypothetical protein